MRKALGWVVAVVVVVAGAAYAAYRYVPVVTEFVDIQMMNMKKLTEFEVKGDKLFIDGLINSKTYGQITEILDSNPQITTLVEGKMEGSIDDDTMFRIGYLVRERGLNTMLLATSDINSGAVDLFTAGVERTMEKGAHIGVHSWSDGLREGKDFPRGAPEHENNRKYTEAMLGADDFYWYTLQAAPADGIHEMSEAEIARYGLLTRPIITDNLTIKEGKVTGVISNKVGGYVIGNAADTVIVNLQGGPVTEFALGEAYGLIGEQAGADLDKVAIVNIHQAQTLEPWNFASPISFEQAKDYDRQSVQDAADVINAFKAIGKKVYVVGISFGAFVAEDLIATHGDIADGYLIMVGRLDMPAPVWKKFAEGTYVGFQYGPDGDYTVIPFTEEQAGMGGSGSIEDQNMARLAAGLGYKRFTQLLDGADLSKVVYAYGKTDEQVGRLSQEEVAFLRNHGAMVLEGDGDHGGTIDKLIKQGLKQLGVPIK